MRNYVTNRENGFILGFFLSFTFDYFIFQIAKILLSIILYYFIIRNDKVTNVKKIMIYLTFI